MKKSKMTMLGVMSVSALLVLAGCKADPTTPSSSENVEASSEVHVHTADAEWHHDENNHWHVCTGCGEKMDVAAHSFEETVVAPTDDEQGYTLHTCACGYTFKDKYTDKEYAVSFDGGEYGYVIGLPEKAKRGETISFKVTVESGYEASSVLATAGEATLELAGSLREGFTFTMPAADVAVKVETRGAYFELAPVDKDAVVVQPEYEYATPRKLGDFIGGFVVDGKIYTGTALYARAGAKVNILSNYIANTDNVSFTADGVALEAEDLTYLVTTGEGEEAKTEEHIYKTFAFTMPNHAVVLGVTATEKAFQIEVEAPDYVTTLLYTKDSEGVKHELTTGIHGGMGPVYLDVALDGEHQDGNYAIDGVSYEYQTASGYEIKPKTVTGTVTKESDGTYSYPITSYTSYYGVIKLAVSVLEAKYIGASWVGEYGGSEFYDSTGGTSGYTISATAFGKIVVGGGYSKKNYNVISVDETKGKIAVSNVANATEPSTYAFYDGDVLMANYYDTRLDDFSDMYIAIRGKSNSDITWEKSTGGKLSKDSAIYIVAKDKTTGEELGNVLYVLNEIYINVTITYDEGYTDVNASSNFSAYKNGELVKHFELAKGASSSSSDDGGWGDYEY